jgi:GTP-binding protein EngB required for normal cell division
MKQNIKEMYDIIFACESLDKLIEKNNEWKYYYSERYKDLILSKKNEKYSKIRFIGETNKGKTFILNQLTGNELKSGEEFKTEGLS